MRGAARIRTRQAWLLSVTAALLAVNLAFFLWYRSTSRERRDALEARRTSLEREVQDREQEAVTLSRQRDRLSQVSSAIEEFYGRRVGPSRDALAPVVEELHAVLRRAGISPSQISYATAPMQDLPLSQMTITFGFKSDYSHFKELISLLEADRRWIVVRDVSLSRDTDTPGFVQVRMALATYFSGEERPALRPAEAPRASLPRNRPR